MLDSSTGLAEGLKDSDRNIYVRTTLSEVAVYIKIHKDYHGEKPNGANTYTLLFPLGSPPEKDEVLSLTMYDMNNNLRANPNGPYATFSLSDNRQITPDGSLIIYIQKDSPGKNREDNWLPTPEGDFWVMFHSSGPANTIVEQP